MPTVPKVLPKTGSTRISQTIKSRYVESGLIPGALTLVWRRGEIAHLGLSGVSDLERGTAMAEDAIFRIYSMTKPVTSVALLMLLEEGKVALDDFVHRYIPGFEHLGVFGGGNLDTGFLSQPAARPMKVIDLMRHTSGLTYGFLGRTNLDAAYAKLKIGEADTVGRPAGDDRATGAPAAGILARHGMELFRRHRCAGLSGGEDFRPDIRRFCAAEILRPWACTDTDFHVPGGKTEAAGELLLRQGRKAAAL